MIIFWKAVLCCLIFILLNGKYVSAQISRPKYEFGINAGTYIYQGDLSPGIYGSFKTPGVVFGIHGSRNITRKVALRLDASFGKLKGDESKYWIGHGDRNVHSNSAARYLR
jgi:hypothetical protein